MERKLINQGQPQTLQAAVMLMYFLGVLNLLQLFFGGATGPFLLIALVVIAGQLAAAFFTANDKKWGYWLAVFFAIAPLAEIVALSIYVKHFIGFSFITLITQLALVALLLHTQSREYKRIWFR